MPSLIHQGLLALLEAYPRLVFELAHACGARVIGLYDDFDAGSSEFEDPGRREVTVFADAVLLGIVDLGGLRTIADAIVIEIQLGKDAKKHRTWAIYRVGARSRHGCCGWTLVLSLDSDVRAWARELFEREPELTPLIVEPSMIPNILTLDQARMRPELAVLSAALHGRGPDALQRANLALRAVAELAPASYERYYPVAISQLDKQQMPHVVKFPPSKKHVPDVTDYERKHWAFIEGEAKGKAEGKAEGRAEDLELLRRSLLDLAAEHGLEVDDEQRAHVRSCTDVQQIARWLARVATARTVAELLG